MAPGISTCRGYPLSWFKQGKKRICRKLGQSVIYNRIAYLRLVSSAWRYSHLSVLFGGGYTRVNVGCTNDLGLQIMNKLCNGVLD